MAKKGGVKMRAEVGAEMDGGRVVKAETQSLGGESLLEQRCSGGLLYDGAFAGVLRGRQEDCGACTSEWQMMSP